MKFKTLLAIALLPSVLATTAHADELGGEIELGIWNTTQNSTNGSTARGNVFMIAGQFEHPIPLLPNLRFDALTINNKNVAVTQSAFTGYWQIMDSDRMELDVGAGVTAAYDGSFANRKDSRKLVIGLEKQVTNVDDVMPHIYAAARIAVPFIENLSIFSNYYRYEDHRSGGYDIRGGLKYNYSVGGVAALIIRAGYRKLDGDFLHHTKSLNSNGAFVSVALAA
ncbi:hypothetical protein [Photobacterium damselae]|uniref:hypothetical protein n=1 Tax=Photobacterium damselae TaxID=38293 RepID=UPI0040688210